MESMIFRDKTKSMWADALDMLEQADRLQRQFFQVSQARLRAPDMGTTGRYLRD